MKKSILFLKLNWLSSLTILLLSSSISAAEIHIAKDGVNAVTGRGTESSPYKTIMYPLNNNLVNSGDIIVIHEGFYRETVTINKDNIIIKPYQSDKVTISGANWYGSSSWTPDTTRSGVFKLALNKSQVETDFTQLFVDGVHQQIARFPNNTTPLESFIEGQNREMMDPLNQESGFAVLLNANKPTGVNAQGNVTFSNHEGTSTIPNVAFTNEAIVRGFIGKLRNNIFCYSQDGGQVTRTGDRLVSFKSFSTQGNSWATSEAYSAPEGFGYIMDLSVLDYEGEWFYKQTENTLYYKPEGGTVDGKNFEIRRRRHVLKVNADNVSIENINFKAGEVELKNAKGTTLTKCKFTYMTPYVYRRNYGVYGEGIVLDNADETTFESCYIGHTWGSGIIIESDSDNTIINNSYIEDIGWMGQFTVALHNQGNNSKITHNTFGSASRFHIRTTEHVYAEIMDNDFYEAMSMGEDAGSIMFTSTGKSTQLNMQGTIIAYNKIHDMTGIPAYDTDPYYRRQKVVALYLEDVDNYTVHHNLVYDINLGNYVSKRVTNGVPAETQYKADAMYLGPRTKQLTRKMYYYNNTFWNYNYFATFWQLNGGDVNDLRYKNNLLMDGKPSSVSSISETNLSTFAQKASSQLNYNITVQNNGTITTSTNHFEDATTGNFRLKPSSSFNNAGLVISGITTEATPALGAWEGNTDNLKNRVFNAGSNLTSSSFDINNLSTNTDKVTDNQLSLYPNPFNDELTIKLKNTASKVNHIRFYNVNGNLILSKSFTKDQTKLNLNNISTGIYFLEINTDKQKIIKKVIKQ